MSTSTTNLHLTKPAANEHADIAIINANYDLIDDFAGTVVVDPDYVHTENNYTTTEKQKLAGLENYTLPTASSSTKGGVKVDDESISIDQSGTISAALSGLNEVNIDAVTLSDGQILKFDATSGKWVNASESGGTGGHTIIDENGNSMTARAGLQFVGGANVDDDATNNKTIVDLASAGGIDGVFIDTNNLIVDVTMIPTSGLSYTATEDCFVYVYLWGSSSTVIKINGIEVGANYASDKDVYLIPLKKGQIITTTAGNSNNTYQVYGIQTGTTHSKFQPVIYSTEEREIGVWTDGKPLYSKVVEIQSFSSASPISIDVSSLNVDTMVDVVGEAYAIYNNVITEVLYFPIYKFANVYTAQIRYSNNAIQIYHESLNEYTRGIVKILYTKSTDVAGSGSWTPQGVPTHHYSTDEQVIGTWIDGSTLYEKSFVFNTPIEIAYNSPTNTSIDSSEMDIIISAIGIHADGTNYGTFVADPTRSSHTVLGLTTPRNNNSATIKYLTLQYTKTS